MTPPSLPRRRAGVLRPSMRTVADRWAAVALRCTILSPARKAKLFDSSVLQAARWFFSGSPRRRPETRSAIRPAPPRLPEAIYKVVLLLRNGRRRPGRSRRRLLQARPSSFFLGLFELFGTQPSNIKYSNGGKLSFELSDVTPRSSPRTEEKARRKTDRRRPIR